MCSVLYQPPKEVYVETGEQESSEDEEENEEGGEEEDFNWTMETEGSGTPELSCDIRVVVKKVTKIVNTFRNSPKLWERLLKRTDDELEDGPLGLKKHCRTRWNALFFSLRRFYKIR